MEQGANRVYINPNFHRAQRNVPQNKSMHINPNFPQYMPNIQTNTINSTKIYVNPIFIRTNTTVLSNNNYVKSALTLPSNNLLTPTTLVPNIRSICTTIVPQPTASTTKSRYSLVRCTNSKQIKENQPLEKVTTYKVSKYKSVSMQHLKNNLHTGKSVEETPFKLMTKQTSMQIRKTSKVKLNDGADIFASRYKLIKRKSQITPIKIGIKTTVNKKSSTSVAKGIVRINVRAKLKINRTHLKKNNVPCPLFRKYGKCLRSTQGKCEYLHDKKHVSICRKFLKGICHDNECLLSHDLSKEKMPTCHFYLKGMCTKEDCPYLHVKLSENTKICIDFLKGYCEKGDECLKRHINICPEVATKGVCSKKQCPYPHKSNQKLIKLSKINMKTKGLNFCYKASALESSKKRRASEIEENKQTNVSVPNMSDCRYYKEVGESTGVTETCEVIKPTRCKLGTLPSFIQL